MVEWCENINEKVKAVCPAIRVVLYENRGRLFERYKKTKQLYGGVLMGLETMSNHGPSNRPFQAAVCKLWLDACSDDGKSWRFMAMVTKNNADMVIPLKEVEISLNEAESLALTEAKYLFEEKGVDERLSKLNWPEANEDPQIDEEKS